MGVIIMARRKKKTYAVVIGLGANGLAVVRALGKFRIPVIVLLSKQESLEPYAATKYAIKWITDTRDEASIMASFSSLDKNSWHLLFPTTDYVVSFLSRHRDEIPRNCMVQFPEASVVETLVNKDKFHQFARANRFPVPRTLLVSDTSHIDDVCRAMTFPVIAKTRTKTYKKGLPKAFLIDSHEELRKWYDGVKDVHGSFVIQEFIPGGDEDVFFALQYISSRHGKLLASFTGKKIRQWPPLTGGTASAEPAFLPELTEITYNFFTMVGFRGIGSMEYKRDPRNGIHYMIEPTVCRTDFQEGVAIANGVNIPLIAYRDALGIKQNLATQRKSTRKAWMHFTADRLARNHHMNDGKLTYFSWLFSLRHVRASDLFSLSDIGPSFRLIRRKFLRK